MYNETLQTLSNESSYKTGCTSTEAAQIKARLEAGETVDQVSTEMRIVKSCVESFHPDFKPAAAEEETDPGEGFFKKKRK